jgi:hypothetical protein
MVHCGILGYKPTILNNETIPQYCYRNPLEHAFRHFERRKIRIKNRKNPDLNLKPFRPSEAIHLNVWEKVSTLGENFARVGKTGGSALLVGMERL